MRRLPELVVWLVVECLVVVVTEDLVEDMLVDEKVMVLDVDVVVVASKTDTACEGCLQDFLPPGL